MFLSMHINLHLPYMCMFLLVPSVLAQNVLHLDIFAIWLIHPTLIWLAMIATMTYPTRRTRYYNTHSIFLFSCSQFIGYTLPAFN
jgi:hypothetical protein